MENRGGKCKEKTENSGQWGPDVTNFHRGLNVKGENEYYWRSTVDKTKLLWLNPEGKPMGRPENR